MLAQRVIFCGGEDLVRVGVGADVGDVRRVPRLKLVPHRFEILPRVPNFDRLVKVRRDKLVPTS